MVANRRMLYSSAPQRDLPLEVRFHGQVGLPDSNGCINWQGSMASHGYGIIGSNGRSLYAHRIAYELAKGPIPEGLFVMHACDNPRCVNPDHLSVGTQKDNIADAAAKGRTARGSMVPRSILTEEAVQDIRREYASGTKQLILAERYGVAQPTISDVVTGRRWGWLP